MNNRIKKIIQIIFLLLLIFFTFLFFLLKYGKQELISLFPIQHYEQKIETWINPTQENYHRPLLTPDMQKKYRVTFFNHYFGIYSPWNVDYVSQILATRSPHDLKSIEKSIIKRFTEKIKAGVGYGANFRPYTVEWLHRIIRNIDLIPLDHLQYDMGKRAIAINNLSARVLPTDEVFFYHYKIPGEGYPFDNLQISAVWAGTPLYILAESKDREWTMVLTPEFIGWVRTNGIARINNVFANTWIEAAKKTLAAITHTQTPVIDDSGQFRFSAYVGSVFPLKEKNNAGVKILIPVADENRQATIKSATLALEHAVPMPLSPTPHHFAKIMNTLLGRSYGWGGMYFFNDCSAELKSLFTPFGIWLPRYSAHQVHIGKRVDMTASKPKQRIAFLAKNGHPFFTLVYIGGHIFLYIGTYPIKKSAGGSTLVMTYQNLWGLKPNPATGRSVIGQSVFLPLLLEYPENTHLNSLADRNYFQISYLDQDPNFAYKASTTDLFQ